MKTIHILVVVCLLLVCGCVQKPVSPDGKRASRAVVAIRAVVIEVEGVKTVSTETGPHRAIEYIRFSVTSPEHLKGKEVLISADKPHPLPRTKGESLRFRIDSTRLSKDGSTEILKATIGDIELVP